MLITHPCRHLMHSLYCHVLPQVLCMETLKCVPKSCRRRGRPIGQGIRYGLRSFVNEIIHHDGDSRPICPVDMVQFLSPCCSSPILLLSSHLWTISVGYEGTMYLSVVSSNLIKDVELLQTLLFEQAVQTASL